MKYTYFVISYLIIVAILGCEQEKDSNALTSVTTLTLSNESFSELTDVIWKGIIFADNWDPLGLGRSIKKTVDAGEGYVFFSRKTNPIVARTKDIIVVEAGKDNSFRLTDNTLIVEASNPDNTGTLKDLILEPVAPITEFSVNNASSFLVARTKIEDSVADTYTITITNSFSLDHTIYFNGSGKKIILLGDNITRSIFYDNSSSSSGLFSIENGVTLELGNNISLNNTSDYVVSVKNGGSLIMNNGSTIYGSQYRSVVSSGTFIMNGGTIRDNIYNQYLEYSDGGGVGIYGGTFTMNNGSISNNNSRSNGGGVLIYSGTFIMNGGTIRSNNANFNGGGIYVDKLGSFIKSGGIIDDTNTAIIGKVVYVENGNKKRDSTADSSTDLNSTRTGVSGGWE